MSNKTMPEWGETYHIDGRPWVVIQEITDTGVVKAANHQGSTLVVRVERFDEYKPRLVTIGDYCFPEPMLEEPLIGEEYWYVSFSKNQSVSLRVWQGSLDDLSILQRGLAHRSKPHAVQHAVALISMSRGETQ